MSILNGLDGFVFGNLLPAGLHHHDSVFGAGHHDVELRFARFRIGWIGNAAPVHQAHAHPAQHMLERNIRNRERGARANHRQGGRVLLRIGRQNHRDDLRLVQVTFGK